MLDAYIIDRIRRERERAQERSRPALPVPPPPPPEPPKNDGEGEEVDGAVIVDYRVYSGVMSMLMWLNHASGYFSHSGFSSGS